MARRMLAILMLVGLMVCTMGTVHAQPEVCPDVDADIVERLTYAGNARVYLDISGRSANIRGVLTAISSQYRCELTLSLRKYQNGNWDHEVDSWSTSGSGLIGASINAEKAGLAAGKYMVHLTGRIYDSSDRLLETVSRDSAQRTVY